MSTTKSKLKRLCMSNQVIMDEDGYELASTSKSNLLSHMIDSYGGINSLLSSVTNTLKYIPKFRNNKALSIIGRTVTMSMVAYDMITKVKEYYDEKSNTVNDLKAEYIHNVLGNDEKEYLYRYDANELKISSEHIDWLLNPHNEKMGGIAIQSYYDLLAGKKYTLLPGSKQFGILIEYNETLMLLEIEQMSMLNSTLYTFKKLWTLDSEEVNGAVDTMNARYMDSVGFEDNVITYDGMNIITRERSNIIDFDITSIEFDRVHNDIKTTLDNGNRRGILFTGNPGTGKTSVLLKLEEVLTEYPILYITASNLNDEYAISRLETFMHNIGKCVVFIEDMDALEIDKKTKRIAPILSLLDNSRNMSPVVFIATINDASLITPSIVRTGRFDEVIEIEEPSTNEEIYSIMSVAWMRHADVNLNRDLSFITYMRLKWHKFTQSDYCEIVQKMHLHKHEFNDKNVISAMKDLIKSKNAFKKYQTK
jgi:hypothetical protein